MFAPERRILRTDVVDSIGACMRPGGVLHFASDVAGYPDEARDVVASASAPGGGGAAVWEPASMEGRWRPSTRYEREAIAAGRPIEDVVWRFVG